MPLPLDLLILLPNSSRMRPCRKTFWNGTCGSRVPPAVIASSSPTKVPNIIILATQKNRMS